MNYLTSFVFILLSAYCYGIPQFEQALVVGPDGVDIELDDQVTLQYRLIGNGLQISKKAPIDNKPMNVSWSTYETEDIFIKKSAKNEKITVFVGHLLSDGEQPVSTLEGVKQVMPQYLRGLSSRYFSDKKIDDEDLDPRFSQIQPIFSFQTHKISTQLSEGAYLHRSIYAASSKLKRIAKRFMSFVQVNLAQDFFKTSKKKEAYGIIMAYEFEATDSMMYYDESKKKTVFNPNADFLAFDISKVSTDDSGSALSITDEEEIVFVGKLPEKKFLKEHMVYKITVRDNILYTGFKEPWKLPLINGMKRKMILNS